MTISRKIKGLIAFNDHEPVLVGREQLAFLRGYMQGLDLHKLDVLYPLAGKVDGRATTPKARLESIRQDLSSLARRNGRVMRDVRLLWIDPDQLADKGTPSISLEEFRWERDPDSFYTEAELIELYQDEVGEAAVDVRRQARNERLRRRQMAMLSSLEQQLPTPPSRSDSLAAWLPEKLTVAFASADINTVDDLAIFISSFGRAWWKRVSKIGAKRARLIEQWITGVRLADGPIRLTSPQLEVPRQPIHGQLAPLATFVPRTAIMAEVEFVKAWLADFEKVASPNTFRTYSRCLERYVLFYAFTAPAHTTLLGAEVLPLFEKFLSELGKTKPDNWAYVPAQSEWIGSRHAERRTMAWRPFAGALSLSAQRTMVEAVSACLSRMRTASKDRVTSALWERD